MCVYCLYLGNLLIRVAGSRRIKEITGIRKPNQAVSPWQSKLNIPGPSAINALLDIVASSAPQYVIWDKRRSRLLDAWVSCPTVIIWAG